MDQLESGDIIVAGYTRGSWSSENAGDSDLLMVQLDSDGNFVWGWQVRSFFRENPGYVQKKCTGDNIDTEIREDAL